MISEGRKIALVAAMDREVAPLVRDWPVADRELDGRRFRFYESRNAVVVCGGIGAESARRATEAVVRLYRPSHVQSVGLAGALDPRLKAGQIFCPRFVVDVRDGSRTDTGRGTDVLMSFPEIASVAQKAKLARSYSAQAVDMEAAAVAKGASAHGLPFSALKAISDESGFAMPPLNQFVNAEGKFKLANFVLYASIRPWLWLRVIQLARNSARAAQALCLHLSREMEVAGEAQSSLHPVGSR